LDVALDARIQSNTLQITCEVLSLIAGIDEFKGAWRALGTLAPDRLSALRRMATIESIGSSTRIEGSKLSDHEIERLLSNSQITDATSVSHDSLISNTCR
jgi:Fic family protein